MLNRPLFAGNFVQLSTNRTMHKVTFITSKNMQKVTFNIVVNDFHE